MKRLLGVLLILVVLLGVASCKREKEPDEVFFQVTFITTALPYEVTPPESATVKKGETVSA